MATENLNPSATAVSDAAAAPGSGGLSPAARARLQKAYNHGTQNMQSGNNDYATEMFTQCVSGDPGNLVYIQAFLANLQKKYNNNKKGGTLASIRSAGTKASAKKASMKKEWLNVIKAGLEVLKLNPWDVSVLLQMAKACAESGFVECQLAYLKGALDADPKSVEVNRECAMALARMGQYDQAISCWSRIDNAKKNGDEEAKREIANLQVEKTMHLGGLKREAENASAENAAQSAAAAALGGVPIKRTRVTQLEEQIKASPGEITAYAELAEFHAKEEKWADAEAVLRRALSATGGDLRVQEQLEDIQLRHGRQNLVIAEKRAAEKNTAETTELAHRLRADLNRLELDIFRGRVDRYPTNTNWKYELGVRLKRAGNFNEAIKMLQEARNDPKRRGAVLLDLGESFQQIKQYKLAMQHYVAAIEDLPDREEDARKQALYRAGVLAMGLRELDEAEKYLTQLAALDFSYRDVSDRLDKIAKVRNKE